MAYRWTIDGRPLYDETTRDLALEAPNLTMEGNKIGTLTFTIYPNHPEYDNIVLLKSVITVYRDDGLIVSKLRPAKKHLNFRGGIEWTCEELTALLNDIMRRPTYHLYSGTESYWLTTMLSDYATTRSTAVPSGTVTYLNADVCEHYCYTLCQLSHAGVAELARWMYYFGYSDLDIAEEATTLVYNDRVARAVNAFQADKGLPVTDHFDKTSDLPVLQAMIAADQGQHPVTPTEIDINMTFTVGTVSYVDGTETVEHKSEDYIGFWDLIQRELVEDHEKAYIVPVWGETTCALNYVNSDDLPASTQKIRFGENLADLFIDLDTEEAFSVLIPLGSTQQIPRFVQPTINNGPLTIKSVNGNLDYLQDSAALMTFGRKEITKTWSDIQSAAELKSTAQAWFAENVLRLKESVSMNAYELRYAGVDTDYLTFMTNIDCESAKHGLRQVYPLTRISIPFGAPDALVVELGDERQTLTDSLNAAKKTEQKNNRELDARVFDLEHVEDVDSGVEE